MVIHITDAAPCHVPELGALERLCFSLPRTEEQLVRSLADEQQIFLAALDEAGRVLGYAGMTAVLDEGYIDNVAVLPELRRQGIAGLLLTELLRRSEERKLSFVTLEVREHNAPAVALYEKFGFSPVGLRKNYYEKPRENAILMTKSFIEA